MANVTGKRRCSVGGCDGPHEGRGYCSKHYQRWKKHGDVHWSDGRQRRAPICSVEGCDGPHAAKGYCNLHYQRFRNFGDVHRQVRRANGEGTVDAAGYVRLSVPVDTPGAYVWTRPNGEQRAWIFAHRYFMAQRLGRPLLPDESVHHKNGDKTDNRLENLELWASTQPSGQRVEDLLVWAREIIDRYEQVPVRTVFG